MIYISYKALYRKWRPKTFSEIVGQTHIVNTLKNEAAKKMFSHAYIFCGIRGTGKTTAAKILARAVNCLNITPEGDPCNQCAVCEGILSGKIIDVVEIDAASNNGVDNIRDIKDEINYPPSYASYRVYIIDEVHMLSGGAFNALLKTLEEPPRHVIFILATTEAHKVPVTILSRCQRFDFGRIPTPLITEALGEICRSEGIASSAGALRFIAENSEGSMRDALSKLDLCVSSGTEIKPDEVCRILGGVSGRTIFDLVSLVLDGNADAAMKTADGVLSSGVTPHVFFNSLLSHFRKLLICRSAGTSGSLEGFDVTAEDEELLRRQSEATELSFLLYAAELIMQSIRDIRLVADKNVLSDLLILKLVNPQLAELPASVFPRIERLEDILESIPLSGLNPHTVDKSVECLQNNVENSFKQNDNYITHNSKSVNKVDKSVENVVESAKIPQAIQKSNVDKFKPGDSSAQNPNFSEHSARIRDVSNEKRCRWFMDIVRTQLPGLSKFISNAELYFNERDESVFILQRLKAFFDRLDKPEVTKQLSEKTGAEVHVVSDALQIPDGCVSMGSGGNDIPPFVQRAKDVLKDRFTVK